VKGFNKKQDIDYDEIFSLVVKMPIHSSYLSSCCISRPRNWTVRCENDFSSWRLGRRNIHEAIREL